MLYILHFIHGPICFIFKMFLRVCSCDLTTCQYSHETIVLMCSETILCACMHLENNYGQACERFALVLSRNSHKKLYNDVYVHHTNGHVSRT